MNLLNRFAEMHREGRASGKDADRLAPETRRSQCWNIHLSADARRKIDIVDRALRRELVKKPYSLLIVGKRVRRCGRASLFPKKLGKQSTLFYW